MVVSKGDDGVEVDFEREKTRKSFFLLETREVRVGTVVRIVPGGTAIVLVTR